MVKLPQIQKIVAAKSGQGISFLSTLMELVVYTATFAYCYAKEFPFSSYGDSIFVMFQTLAIGFLYLIRRATNERIHIHIHIPGSVVRTCKRVDSHQCAGHNADVQHTHHCHC